MADKLAFDAYIEGRTPIEPPAHSAGLSLRARTLINEILSEVDEYGDYSVSVDADLVDELADELARRGYDVSFPGQDEERDGVTYTALHIERK